MVTIRAADVQDAEGIAHVHVTVWKETYRGLMPDDVLDTLSVARRAEQWKNTLDDSSDLYHAVAVAEADKRIVGFANYGKERAGDKEFHGELYAIYILKEFQRQGIGRALVQQTTAGLLKLRFVSMLVWVLSNNPYQQFYKRLDGTPLHEKSIQIGQNLLLERAYGWRDIRPLAAGTGLGQE